MNCPICDRLLYFDEVYQELFCSKDANFGTYTTKHYMCSRTWQRETIWVPPYKIITYKLLQFSIIEKYKNDTFNVILHTKELNVGPIVPRSEQEMLNRIQTLLVFS